MIHTKPMSHNRVALCVDGFVIFIGSAAQIRQLLNLEQI